MRNWCSGTRNSRKTMSGMLNKLSPNAKTLIVFAFSLCIGIFVFLQDDFLYVFGLMDGFISYFGIMSSVSFAILTILMQRFDGKSLGFTSAKEIKHEAINISIEMNVEVWRIVFMLLPVLAYFMMSFFNELNRFGASLVSATTFAAIVFSIFLPFKYVGFMKSHLINVVEDAQDKEIEKDLKSADELLEKIKNM